MYFFKSKEVFSSDRLKPYRISNLFLDTPKETGFNASYGANSRSYQNGYPHRIPQTSGSREKDFLLVLLFVSLCLIPSPCFRGPEDCGFLHNAQPEALHPIEVFTVQVVSQFQWSGK